MAAPLPHRLAGLESACGQQFLQSPRGDGAERLSVLLVVPPLEGPFFSAHGWPPPKGVKRPLTTYPTARVRIAGALSRTSTRRQWGAGRTTSIRFSRRSTLSNC